MHSTAVCCKYHTFPYVHGQISNIYKYKGKVKLCSQNPQKYVGHGGIAPFMLKLSSRWRQVASFTLHHLYSQGKCPSTH
jgi:hypothetical protein